MKIFFFLLFIFFIFSGCGKKSDPKYQASINQQTLDIS